MPAGVELWCLAGWLALSLLAIAIGRWWLGAAFVYLGCLAVSAIAGADAVQRLLGGDFGFAVTLPLGLPTIGMHLRIDALSAFFLIVVNLGAALASLYALGYGRREAHPLRVVPYYPLFITAMNVVVLADDAFTFLLAWEFMSLSSWAMVTAHHENENNVRAGYIYLLMASFGTLCLLFAFGLMAGADGGYAFATIRAAHPSATVAGVALLLVLAGAGSKAGLVPLHVWLPLAHPAAPTHVSALLSGVMTKIAIYGFVRLVFDLLPAPSPWSAMVVLALGGITAALGILYAVMQRDLKRLLAYSTVENIGIIFIGLGLALAFRANGVEWAAALALTAALLHVLNHSLFKSLLFFGAGAVQTATGERDIDHLGGLIHKMPATALAFLIGSAAISALPPLNGFVSEWLTFQAILVSPQLPQWGLKFLIPAAGALMALAVALAATGFVKAYGIAFLGRPRTLAAEQAREVNVFSLAAMFVPAALCFLAGVLPGVIIDWLAPVVRSLAGGSRVPAQLGLPWLSIVPIAESRSSYNGIVILAFLLISGVLTAMFVHRFATRAMRRSAIWDGGFPLNVPITQYSELSFAMPIRRVFATTVFHVREIVDMPKPGDMRAGHFQVRVFDPAWRFVYGPLTRAVGATSGRLDALQFLSIRRYLSLVFSALIILLIVVAAWG